MLTFVLLFGSVFFSIGLIFMLLGVVFWLFEHEHWLWGTLLVVFCISMLISVSVYYNLNPSSRPPAEEAVR